MMPWLWALGDAVLGYLAPLLAGVAVGTALQARFGVRPKVATLLMVVFVAASFAALFVPAPISARIGLSLLAGLGAGMAIELEPAPRRPRLAVRPSTHASDATVHQHPRVERTPDEGGAPRAAPRLRGRP